MSKKESQIYLGTNFRLLCAVYNMTYKDVAKKLNVHPNYITRISESDSPKARHPLGALIELSDLFKVDLETLLRTDLSQEIKRRSSESSC